jgi:hypothetical protein
VAANDTTVTARAIQGGVFALTVAAAKAHPDDMWVQLRACALFGAFCGDVASRSAAAAAGGLRMALAAIKRFGSTDVNACAEAVYAVYVIIADHAANQERALSLGAMEAVAGAVRRWCSSRHPQLHRYAVTALSFLVAAPGGVGRARRAGVAELIGTLAPALADEAAAGEAATICWHRLLRVCPMPPPRRCDGCGAEETAAAKLRKCGACHGIYYCTAACQKLDWKTHKKACAAAVAAAAGGAGGAS